jgi:hypothetical protein
MADVTIPTIGAGVSNGTVVEQNFYNPTATGTTSAEIVNGHLDDANRNPAWKVNRSQIQHRALSLGKSEGGSLSLDYFGELFPGWNVADDVSAEAAKRERMDTLYQVIPGASVSFYLPYDPSFILFSWQVFVSAEQEDTVDDAPQAHPANRDNPVKLRFFLNGARVTQRDQPVPTKVWDATDTRGTYDRVWTGHYMTTSINTPGWYNASLRIAADPGYNGNVPGVSATRFPVQSSNTLGRVRVRSMSYVIFR